MLIAEGAGTYAETRGKVALITGGSRGIGRAVAETLLRDGYRVVITGRNAETLAATARQLGSPDRVLGIPGNAADPEHRVAATRLSIDTFGSLDVLVNNTGINPVLAPLAEIDLAAVRKIMDTNVIATLGWVQEVHRTFMGEHGGAIVNVASIGGLSTSTGSGAYGMSKAALIHMTKQLAVELAPRVRVNAVAPAVVKTRFAAALFEGREDEVSARYPLRRLGTPEDVSEAVRFLVSPAASWITGQTLVIDGGILSSLREA